MATEKESVLARLNRISLNNEIVLLRRVVAQAKVNVIRKITKEIKVLKLEKSHHTEEIKLRNQAKSKRLIDELRVIKTLNNDDVSKTALIYDCAESLEVLKDPTSTVKEKLLAKIARDKVIVKGIEKMLSKYHPITKKKLEYKVSNIGFNKRRRRKLGVPGNLTKADNETYQSFDGSDEEEIPRKNKKELKNSLLKDSEVSSDELEGEKGLVSDDKKSFLSKNERKAKQTIIRDSESEEMDVETVSIDEAEISTKKLKKSRSKKSKTSPDETEHVIDELSPKKRKKARRASTEDLDGVSDEMESVALKKNDAVELTGGAKGQKSSAKKSKKSSSAMEVDEELDCIEQVEISMEKKSKKKKGKLDSIEALDHINTVEEETNRKEKIEVEKVLPEPKKVVHSTKAIRFSELLEMEAKSLQPATVKHDISETKEVDEFFVSADGNSNFMTNVIAKRPEVAPKKTINKYEKIREQYLQEYGAVPNRTELRRLEREGTKGSKSFHNLLAAPRENATRTGLAPAAQRQTQPSWLPVVKPNIEDLPVHPSWEAKKKAKEMLAVSFQGKKIKFD